jgi:hypothetical protein
MKVVIAAFSREIAANQVAEPVSAGHVEFANVRLLQIHFEPPTKVQVVSTQANV